MNFAYLLNSNTYILAFGNSQWNFKKIDLFLSHTLWATMSKCFQSCGFFWSNLTWLQLIFQSFITAFSHQYTIFHGNACPKQIFISLLLSWNCVSTFCWNYHGKRRTHDFLMNAKTTVKRPQTRTRNFHKNSKKM